MKNLFIAFLIIAIQTSAQTYSDKPYIQDYAEKFDLDESFKNSTLLSVGSDRNNAFKILSSDGLLQPWEKKLVADNRYRPLSDMNIIAVERYENQFVYLTDRAVLGNAWAGKFYVEHGLKQPSKFVVALDFTTLIAAKGKLVLLQDGKNVWSKTLNNFDPLKLIFDKSGKRFLILTNEAVFQLKCPEKEFSKVYEDKNLTAMAVMDNDIILGKKTGFLILDGERFKAVKVNQKLPWTEITKIKNINGSLWFGSTKGAFKFRDDGKYDYYASKRWLVDDKVVDIAKGPENSVLVLSEKGLSKINFVEMTLAGKADYFQKIQRLRHIRYGFTSDLSLTEAGDISTGFYRDTDNEGLWTSLYLAGELFRYSVTKSEDAKKNAYEAFEAMERLTEITGLDGFPARTYELEGYEYEKATNGLSEEWRNKHEANYGKIWRLTDDKRWRWKSTTSSDESCGHFFVYALFAELAPDKEWRDRAIHQIKIEMDHIIENDWYLVTWNGKPTRWGRWNPEYVNKSGDSKLNSAQIISFLQTAYHFTKDKIYKDKANELLYKHHYLENITTSISDLVKKAEEDGYDGKWNHSDDELAFVIYPGLYKYAFNDDLKNKFKDVIEDHWNFERDEKNPMLNFLYAIAGGKEFDLQESIWWLQEFPMDLIKWNVNNDHRKDLVRVESNIRGREYTEVLPPDECPMHVHNAAYINNGGEDGLRVDSPYIYLLPYWAGRYIEAISSN